MTIGICMRLIIVAAVLLSVTGVLAPGAARGETQPLVQGNTAFALDLYGRLKGAQPNIFFSPYSISTCLAMAYDGARGETAKQMADVFRFSNDPQQLNAGFAALQGQLNQAGKESGIQLNVANALWAQQGHPFLPAFLKAAREDYQANVNQANFRTSAEAARSEVNDWVARKTEERIKDILPPGSVDPMTRLILVNAIYFKGAWASPFKANETHPLPFHTSATAQVQTPMMHQTEGAKYMENDTLQAVELPYRGFGLSMVVLLPRKVDGCAELENRLSPEFLSNTLAETKEQKVEIFLPRFKQDSSFKLNGPLEKMGMGDAFSPSADFSGMDATRQLYISAVFHKAWVDVNETGTEAAAATATTMRALAMMKPLAPPPVFRADHPFIFLIRDTHSGSILFLGRLAQPAG